MEEMLLEYKNSLRKMKMQENNSLLGGMLFATSYNFRFEDEFSMVVDILCRNKKGLTDNMNGANWFDNERIFLHELSKIRPNLSIRGITVYTTYKNSKLYVSVNRNLENDYSGFYFSEEYMITLLEA